MRLPVCNRDYSNSAPRADVDTRPGNCHTCDIHFAISASSFSKRKGPSKGPEQIRRGIPLPRVCRAVMVVSLEARSRYPAGFLLFCNVTGAVRVGQSAGIGSVPPNPVRLG